MNDPKTVDCPNCQAKTGEPCNAPTDKGRRNVTWFHSARENLAAGIAPASPAETLAETLLATLQGDPTVTMIACDCGRDLEMWDEVSPQAVKELIEHAAFEHATRREIDAYRSTKLLTGYEIGVLLKLAPQTDAEQKWRDSRA